MNWFKHFWWFLKISKSFMGWSLFKVILFGGVAKGVRHANYMVKYEKLTPEQKQALYAIEDRTMKI